MNHTTKNLIKFFYLELLIRTKFNISIYWTYENRPKAKCEKQCCSFYSIHFYSAHDVTWLQSAQDTTGN